MEKEIDLTLQDIQKRTAEQIRRRVSQLNDAPLSRGKSLLLKHYSGVALTKSQAVEAHCCECMGYYMDGRHDCENPLCPAYPHMPYGILRKRYQRKKPETKKGTEE